ncbi:MAG: asparagine synthase (glutamine-hydrolyzing) [Deltaproteobacteria bacterium]|nr:asparagine synthase (glutamine-hydrolyzing) [Deltaproteobacteria bacterium]
MCGFAGIFHFGRDEAVDPSVLERMGTVMAHRGPDGRGAYVSPDRRLGLAHRRLSIIDLDGGAQPMVRGDAVLAFNGEIYNFRELRARLEASGARFSTRSDTEVLLEQVGRKGLAGIAELNGIFGFAFRCLGGPVLLARDQLGVKPLYYAVVAGALVFGSEIKAILEHPEVSREVDVDALAECLALRFVPSPKTLFRGIFKLGPGHTLSCTESGPRVQPYWVTHPMYETFSYESDAIDTYSNKLARAVKRQMVSDVPVGLMLSGGVDSALVGALMRRATGERITGYTVGFEGGEKTNEVEDALDTARVIGLEHRSVTVTARDYERFFSEFVWHLEEPSGNESAPAAYFVAKLARPDVKVLLSGQGADEPLAGYDRYLGERYSSLFRSLPPGVASAFLHRLSSSRFGQKNEKIRRSLQALGESSTVRRFVHIYSIFSVEAQQQLWQSRDSVLTLDERLAEIIDTRRRPAMGLDSLSQLLFVDTRLSLPDDLLTAADKMSMAASLELRVPYLDVELVEFLETLPTRYKLRGLSRKWIHLAAARRVLPARIVRRRKKGFANPVDRWIRKELGVSFDALVFAKDSLSSRYFRREPIRAMVDEDRSGRADRKRNLYLLLCLELWHRRFITRS